MALALLQETQKPLSELKQILVPMPRAIQNRKVSKKIPFEELPASRALMAKFEQELGGSGRLFVRYSGTEQKLRVLIEGPDQARINQMAAQIADLILEEITAEGPF